MRVNKKTLLLAFAFFIWCLTLVCADVYLHSPRGSNNRNCEKNVDRNNANRLFDSQNNDKGGYACPRAVGGPEVETPQMYYYAGSYLTIEWTMQHSCAVSYARCDVILQYMCNDTAPGLRDGTPIDELDSATNTIDVNSDGDPSRGRHETLDYYNKCQTRYRNNGLWIADRRQQNPGTLLPTSPATQTRQNPNGNRYGWECPEERDYYPYWHPTPWRDIAIFTDSEERCNFYRQESQNVKNKGECVSIQNSTITLQYNNPGDCIGSGIGQWIEKGAFNTTPPDCIPSSVVATKDNSLGESINPSASGKLPSYVWKIPNDVISDACVLRIRYNITSTDINFQTDYNYNGNIYSPVIQDPFQDYDLGGNLSFAINTDQVGRTFQDRSYVFAIKPRPSNIPSWTRIHNIGVRGKRGNIVDVYPAVQYDFSPNTLTIDAADLVHWQWTGSDYNPPRNPNDGEGGPRDPVDGQLRADRSNLVQLDYPGKLVPRPGNFNTMFVDQSGKVNYELVQKFAFINQNLTDTNSSTRCLNYEELYAKNDGNALLIESDSQNCAKLNKAVTPYFDGGLVRLYASGTFYYYSTRNNNFSNRDQKASITVKNGWVAASPKSTTLGSIVFQYSLALMASLFLSLSHL
jgi:hypothetical protein